MISSKKPDDKVGTGQALDDGRQTAAQKAVLGGGGEEGGRTEPKDGWGEGPEAGRPPVAIGGNSQGQGDRMPAGGATGPETPATNPKTRPGERHEA